MYTNAQKSSQMSKENKFSLITENESRGREVDFSLFPLLYSLIFFSNKLFYKFKNGFIVSIFTSQSFNVLIEVNINRIEMTTIFSLAKLHLYYVEESIGFIENKTHFKHSLFSCLSCLRNSHVFIVNIEIMPPLEDYERSES